MLLLESFLELSLFLEPEEDFFPKHVYLRGLQVKLYFFV